MESVEVNKCFICDKKDVRLYDVPGTQESLEKWLIALGIEDPEKLKIAVVNAVKLMKLCGRHFTIKCFTSPKKIKLTKTAVPTLNLKINQNKMNLLCKESKAEQEVLGKTRRETRQIGLGSPKRTEETSTLPPKKQPKAVSVPPPAATPKSPTRIKSPSPVKSPPSPVKKSMTTIEKEPEQKGSSSSEQQEVTVIMEYEDDDNSPKGPSPIPAIKKENLKIESKYRCRLCLDYYENIISLFTVNESQQKPYMEMLRSFVSLRINENDDFDNVICEICAENIQMSYSFQQLCLQSDMILFGGDAEDKRNDNVYHRDEVDHQNRQSTEGGQNYPMGRIYTTTDDDGSTVDCNNTQQYVVPEEEEIIWEEGYSLQMSNGTVVQIDDTWYDEPSDIDPSADHIPCDFCGKLVERTNYRKHRKRHMKTFECNECGKRFWTENHLQLHKFNHHSGQVQTIYQCDICEKMFISESKLDLHQQTHVQEEQAQVYPCTMCDKVYNNRRSLTAHMKSHESFDASSQDPKGKYICDVCGAEVLIRNMAMHSKLHGSVVDKKSLCEICGSQVTASNITTHMQTHDPNRTKNFKCKFCDSTFFNKYNCKYHERIMHPVKTETDESMTQDSVANRKRKPITKKYVCNVCGARAPSQILLLNHLTLHDPTREKIRKYKCKYCDKRFTQGAHVKTHELLHTGDKPYKCEYCGKRFRHLTTINDHKRIHTGFTPYHCELCNRKFNSQTNYKKHMQSHNMFVGKKIPQPIKLEDGIIEIEEEVVMQEDA